MKTKKCSSERVTLPHVGCEPAVLSEMAACAGIAPATFRSTGGCSSWLS
jgi:hypothetical protein